MSKVSLVRYEAPLASVLKAVELCNGLDNLPSNPRVFVKPNIPFWGRSVRFPKWGVITTSRVVEDMVTLLKERGVNDITIGEGTVLIDPKDKETVPQSFEQLGYNVLKKRYGVQSVSIYDRPFQRVNLGEGVEFNFNSDILESDFVVNIPVLKTHAQTVLSLGIKNMKGMIDVISRKRCHSADPKRNLHFMVSKLANRLPPCLTIIDGIYSTEQGPGFDGKIRRSNILIASRDILSADMVGAKILGYEPAEVPYLVHAAADRGRPLDLSDVEIRGEKVEDLSSRHEYSFQYNEAGTLPAKMAQLGIKGLAYPKYDLTMCTYCSVLNGVILASIAMAWKGEPWDNIEVLTGKNMKPTPGKKTILLGNCLWKALKDHPDIDNMISVKTCPPSRTEVIKALHQAGIDINPAPLENIEQVPAFFMHRYEGKPEFDEALFRIA
jgi:uncharacterized protein (DUF362 family)